MISEIHNDNKHVLLYNRKTSAGVQVKVFEQENRQFLVYKCFVYQEHCFASASTSGLLNIWDANQPAMINQFKIHNATINRLQFHPTSRNERFCSFFLS